MKKYTKYQQKRKFLSKINARIKSLTDRAGVDFAELTNQFDDIAGVFITDAGYLNMETKYFNDDIVAEIESLIPTYVSEVDRAEAEIIDSWKSAKNFVGPRPEKPTKKQINRNIRAKFTFTDDFNENKAKFYEWADKQDAITLKSSQNYNDLKDELSAFGQRWHDGDLNTQDKLDQLEALNNMGFNDFTKLITDKLDKKI